MTFQTRKNSAAHRHFSAGGEPDRRPECSALSTHRRFPRQTSAWARSPHGLATITAVVGLFRDEPHGRQTTRLTIGWRVKRLAAPQIPGSVWRRPGFRRWGRLWRRRGRHCDPDTVRVSRDQGGSRRLRGELLRGALAPGSGTKVMGDSRGATELKGWKRRQLLALLGFCLVSVGAVACGGARGASATPTPFTFPATRPGHDSESGRR